MGGSNVCRCGGSCRDEDGDIRHGRDVCPRFNKSQRLCKGCEAQGGRPVEADPMDPHQKLPKVEQPKEVSRGEQG